MRDFCWIEDLLRFRVRPYELYVFVGFGKMDMCTYVRKCIMYWGCRDFEP